MGEPLGALEVERNFILQECRGRGVIAGEIEAWKIKPLALKPPFLDGLLRHE
jgi:hypothetical protein